MVKFRSLTAPAGLPNETFVYASLKWQCHFNPLVAFIVNRTRQQSFAFHLAKGKCIILVSTLRAVIGGRSVHKMSTSFYVLCYVFHLHCVFMWYSVILNSCRYQTDFTESRTFRFQSFHGSLNYCWLSTPENCPNVPPLKNELEQHLSDYLVDV